MVLILVIEVNPYDRCYVKSMRTKEMVTSEDKNKILVDTSSCDNKKQIKEKNIVKTLDENLKEENKNIGKIVPRKLNIISIGYGFKNNPQDSFNSELHQTEKLINNQINAYNISVNFDRVYQMPDDPIMLGPSLGITAIYHLAEGTTSESKDQIISHTNIILRVGFASRLYINRKNRIDGFLSI